MNPYLEQTDTWQDFHHRFITHAAAAIGEQVRPAYIVKIDEHLYLREPPAEARNFVGRGDVTVGRASGRTGAAPGAATAAPAYARIPEPIDVERQPFIEVRGREDRQLVAVVELLSPANKKPGPDREQYVYKRRQLIASTAHLVEIDLLRGGPRLPLEDLPPCDYYALVSRYEERPAVGVWPIRLRDPLPDIPVPLRAPDPDARLDLQAILNTVYDAAGYGDYVYDGIPQPPLPQQDTAWARDLIPKSA
jgi:hypothetical protein